MQADERINEMFQELLGMASSLLQTRTRDQGYIGRMRTTSDQVSPELATEWGVRSLSLLKRVFGSDSDYYVAFKEESTGFSSFSNYGYVTQSLGILKGAKADFEKGYLLDTHALVQAEVFDDFLEQASFLLGSGYYGPAAIIAGIVLEQGLRKLCEQNNVNLPGRSTIGPMNDALAKTGLYGIVVKQRILALSAIRNQGAHGQWKELTQKEVEQMIEWVKMFMENSFGGAKLSIH